MGQTSNGPPDFKRTFSNYSRTSASRYVFELIHFKMAATETLIKVLQHKSGYSSVRLKDVELQIPVFLQVLTQNTMIPETDTSTSISISLIVLVSFTFKKTLFVIYLF